MAPASPNFRQPNLSSARLSPATFTTGPRYLPNVKSWVGSLPSHHFIALALVLQAACLSWYDNPQKPFDKESHCKVAKAIDSFEQASDFELVSLLSIFVCFCCLPCLLWFQLLPGLNSYPGVIFCLFSHSPFDAKVNSVIFFLF